MSLLPDVVWVQVLSYLKVVDRSRLSQTCKLLHCHFQDPLLWKDLVVELQLFASLNPANTHKYLNMFRRIENYEKRLIRFGKYVRNLSIILIGNLEQVEERALRLLEMVCEKCVSVEELTLEVGRWDLPVLPSSCSQLLSSLTTFTMSLSQNLHRLNLHAWPVGVQGLTHALITDRLRHLSIFHKPIGLQTWIHLNSILPHPTQIQESLSRLKQLTSLSLHCSCVNQALLQSLSSSPPTSSPPTSSSPSLPNLQNFHILIISDKTTSHFYNIPSGSWQHVLSIHPSLLLHVTIGNTIPKNLLFSFFHPSITPSIRSISICKFARYSPDLLTHIDASINCPTKNTTLRSFTDFSDGCSHLIQLTSFIQSFPSIDQLVYNGNLYHSDVLHLVHMRNWRKFVINIDKILINYSCFDDDDTFNNNSINNNSNFSGINSNNNSNFSGINSNNNSNFSGINFNNNFSNIDCNNNSSNIDSDNNFSHNSTNDISSNNDTGDSEDDLVLFKDSEGGYRQRSLCEPNKGFFRSRESEEVRERVLQTVLGVLQEKLHCPWTPLTRRPI